MRKVLADAARNGLLGDHHFNIAFKTHAPGVVAPAAVKQRFPDEMSIILQHEFWDLAVTQDAFEVSLNFSRKPERLIVPFDSITGFTDPSVPFGFKLEPRVSEPAVPTPAVEEEKAPIPAPAPAPRAPNQDAKLPSTPQPPCSQNIMLRTIAVPIPIARPTRVPVMMGWPGAARLVISITSARRVRSMI